MLVSSFDSSKPVFYVQELNAESEKVGDSVSMRLDPRVLPRSPTEWYPVFASDQVISFVSTNGHVASVDPSGNVITSGNLKVASIFGCHSTDTATGKMFWCNEKGAIVEVDLKDPRLVREFEVKDAQGEVFEGWNVVFSQDHLFVENDTGVLKVSWPGLDKPQHFRGPWNDKPTPVGLLYSKVCANHIYFATEEWIWRKPHTQSPNESK